MRIGKIRCLDLGEFTNSWLWRKSHKNHQKRIRKSFADTFRSSNFDAKIISEWNLAKNPVSLAKNQRSKRIGNWAKTGKSVQNRFEYVQMIPHRRSLPDFVIISFPVRLLEHFSETLLFLELFLLFTLVSTEIKNQTVNKHYKLES